MLPLQLHGRNSRPSAPSSVVSWQIRQNLSWSSPSSGTGARSCDDGSGYSAIMAAAAVGGRARALGFARYAALLRRDGPTGNGSTAGARRAARAARLLPCGTCSLGRSPKLCIKQQHDAIRRPLDFVRSRCPRATGRRPTPPRRRSDRPLRRGQGGPHPERHHPPVSPAALSHRARPDTHVHANCAQTSADSENTYVEDHGWRGRISSRLPSILLLLLAGSWLPRI